MRTATSTASIISRQSPSWLVVQKPSPKCQETLRGLTLPLTDLQQITATALDVLEERLANGEKLLKEARSRPNVLDFKSLAQEIGLPGTWVFKHFKKRIAALVKKYGLSSRGLERYSFEDFRAAALIKRAEQLASRCPIARREKTLQDLNAAFDWAASLVPSASARKTLAVAGLAASISSKAPDTVFVEHLAWARDVFQGWLVNRNLPADPATLLSVGLCRLGIPVHFAARRSGLTTICLGEIIDGRRRPLTTQYRKIGVLEKFLDLPEGAAVEGFRRMPADEVEIVDPSADVDYRLHDLPEEAEREWNDYVRFRTSPVVPRGMKRHKTILAPTTLKMMRDMFASLYGFCTTPLNREFRIDPMNVGMALLLFPDLVHASWDFVLARTGKPPTRWNVDWVRKWMRLIDADLGFVTQSPSLADRLVPIRDVRGRYLVSPKDIARVKADWPGACAEARKEYAALRESQSDAVELAEDPLAEIEEILKLPNPLDAFRMLCQGVRQKFQRAKRDAVGAAAVRSVVLTGLLTQCAFRGFTIEQLNIEHLVRNPDTGRWWMRVPRQLFKNKNGPFFQIGQTRSFIPFYERELLDKHGLYEAIDAYLDWARARILKNQKGYETDALFVTTPRARRGLRARSNHDEPGRINHDYLAILVHELTAEHVGWNAKTGTGIKGIVSFPTHRFRAILATGIMKCSKGRRPKREAADAIHDSENTVEIYLRFLPRDSADDVTRTMDESY